MQKKIKFYFFLKVFYLIFFFTSKNTYSIPSYIGEIETGLSFTSIIKNKIDQNNDIVYEDVINLPNYNFLFSSHYLYQPKNSIGILLGYFKRGLYLESKESAQDNKINSLEETQIPIGFLMTFHQKPYNKNKFSLVLSSGFLIKQIFRKISKENGSNIILKANYENKFTYFFSPGIKYGFKLNKNTFLNINFYQMFNFHFFETYSYLTLSLAIEINYDK